MRRYILFILAIFFSSALSYAQRLEDYFELAALNNPGLQAVHKEYEAALQKVDQIGTLPDPTFTFGYFISPVETRVGPQLTKLSLRQMFPWFGTLQAEGDAAALLAEARFQRFIEARNKLFLQVASAYYSLYENKKLLQIERENIRILKSYKSIASEKLINGTGSMVDVLRVDMELEEAQTRLSLFLDKERPLLMSFNKLLNRPGNERVNISDSLTITALSENYRKDSLLIANPGLKALDLKTHSSKAGERAAQKQGLPKLGLGVDYLLVGERTDISLPDNGKDVFMPSVSVSIPLFRKKYNALRREAQLKQEGYALQKQELANALSAEYETAWFQVQEQLQFISLYEQQIESTQQSLNLLYTDYGNSGKDFREVVRMQQRMLKYRRMRATAMAQYHIAVQKIHYITSKPY